MILAADILRREQAIADRPGQAAAAIEPLLLQLAGEDCALVSLTLDYGAPAKAGESGVAEAWIDRSTRTLVFAHGRLLGADGRVVAAASAVLKRAARPAGA